MPITSKSTKAQLLSHIACLEAEVLARGRDVAALREQLAMAKPVAYQAPRAPRALPQHFAAARAMAIATGRSVKCGA